MRESVIELVIARENDREREKQGEREIKCWSRLNKVFKAGYQQSN